MTPATLTQIKNSCVEESFARYSPLLVPVFPTAAALLSLRYHRNQRLKYSSRLYRAEYHIIVLDFDITL
jgi:hypothetical protein